MACPRAAGGRCYDVVRVLRRVSAGRVDGRGSWLARARGVSQECDNGLSDTFPVSNVRVSRGILLVLSTDVRRFRVVIQYVAVATAVLGILLFGIDVHAGMPGWWTALEGPPVTVLGMLLLWLLRRIPPDAGLG